MKITPLEIRQKTFDKKLRGLDKDEVNAFLQSLSHEWERMLDDNKDVKIRLEKADKEVLKLREVENTLYKTLKTAEDTSANVIDQANKTAELHMRETQINAEAMLNDAKHKAKIIIENADVKARELVEEMQSEVKDLEENYRIIENQRDNLISQLKIVSGDVMEKMTKLRDQEANSGLESHLKKVKQMMRETSEHATEDSNIQLSEVKPLKKLERIVEVQAPIKEVVEDTRITTSLVQADTDMSDEIKVKKNHILGNKPIERQPIERTPIQNTGKVIEAVNHDDLSFFDQLDD